MKGISAINNDSADLLLINGTIDTLTDQATRVSALAIRDGKMAGLGEEAEKLRAEGTTVLDLQGAYVMPGLLDVHNHHMLVRQMDLFELNVPPTLGLAELLEAVAADAAELGPDE